MFLSIDIFFEMPRETFNATEIATRSENITKKKKRSKKSKSNDDELPVPIDNVEHPAALNESSPKISKKKSKKDKSITIANNDDQAERHSSADRTATLESAASKTAKPEKVKKSKKRRESDVVEFSSVHSAVAAHEATEKAATLAQKVDKKERKRKEESGIDVSATKKKSKKRKSEDVVEADVVHPMPKKSSKTEATAEESIVLKQAAPVVLAKKGNDWSHASFGGDSARQDRFLRLLGAKKPGTAPVEIAQSTKRVPVSEGKLNRDLESEFEKSRRLQQERRTGKRSGLGA